MKKLLALMLAAALALSLVACGGGGGTGDNNTPSGGNGDTTSTDTPSGGGEDSETEEPVMTKEEMLQVAEEVSWTDIQNASVKNIASAKQQYCDKVMQLDGKIWSIEEDHIVIGGTGDNYLVDVYLPLDEIITLENQQIITVVGKTTDEIVNTTENVAEYSFDFSYYQMPNAYLVKDTVEWNCKTRGPSMNDDYDWIVEFENSNILHHVYFSDSVDITTLGLAMELKLSGKQIDNNLHDAIIIE
ncbi:MAG: hypothetical protein K2P37_05005 [Oscillospiraceae bacterium]|nr:hypothetical protein [Oscillospiraceae bacterium]